MSVLGKRIREYRIKRGFTQAQMAEKLNMTESNYSSYERDKSKPPSDKLYQIASILNVSVDYLLGRSNDPEPDFEFDDEVRSLARDIQGMDSEARDALKVIVKSMIQRGREALKD